MTKNVYQNTAAAKDLASALTLLPDRWVVCRDVRHAWSVMNDFYITPMATSRGSKITRIDRDLVCMRCETVRHEIYHHSRSGMEKVSQGYEYPEGYQIPGVPRGMKPSAIVQQEQYRRAMERVANAAPGETEKAEK